jgi:signal transduction histidine kinase
VSDYRTLGEALAELERLGRRFPGLLTLSRAGAGRLALDRRATDLTELAARAVGAYAPRAAASDVELRLDADTRIAVQADSDRLREVVDNLLDNALRVAPKGSSIRVGVSRHDGQCLLEVEDAGPGLSADEQAQVFEPFARGAAPGGDGAGLGLAIARAVAEAHGGHLGVRRHARSSAIFGFRELPADAAGAPHE